jgi:predicted Zn-dependent protease
MTSQLIEGLEVSPLFPNNGFFYCVKKSIYTSSYQNMFIFVVYFIFNDKKHFIMSNFSFFTCVKSGLGLATLVLLSACARNPVTGKRQLSLMSEQQEIALGTEADPGIIQQFGVYDDQKIQDFINLKGQEMARISHRPNLKFTFRVLNSNVVNAFALPGGYVYFTRGIMAHFNNEAEFAGVLGHEIGHVTARHGAQQQTQQILAQVGLIAGIIAVPQFAQFAEAAQQGLGLMFLKFGRNHESQSDKLGVEYSTKIGYNSLYMADFFKTLGRITDAAGARIPTFLSTHPDPDDRYGNVKRQSEEVQKTKNAADLKVNRDQFLRMIDGIVYGEDPREGYVENLVFYHPELKFQFPTPRDWQTQNSPMQFTMVDKNQKAMMLFTIAQGKTLEEAAQNTAKQLNLNVGRTDAKLTNGIRTLVIASEVKQEQTQQQQGATNGGSTQQQGNTQSGMKRKSTGSSGSSTTSSGSNASPQQQTAPKTLVLSYYYEFGGNIYVLHGVALDTDFQANLSTFRATMEGFAELKDQSKINVQPEHIRVKTASKSATLGELLTSWGIPQKRQEETAILNSMFLSNQVTSGTLIKTIGK